MIRVERQFDGSDFANDLGLSHDHDLATDAEKEGVVIALHLINPTLPGPGPDISWPGANAGSQSRTARDRISLQFRREPRPGGVDC